MGAVIEVKYFNSFVLKKVSASNSPVWNGSLGIPDNLNGGYPLFGTSNDDNDWVVEEARIRGDRNLLKFNVMGILPTDPSNSKMKSRNEL